LPAETDIKLVRAETTTKEFTNLDQKEKGTKEEPETGVNPQRWTVKCSAIDRLAAVHLFELVGGQVSERGVKTALVVNLVYKAE